MKRKQFRTLFETSRAGDPNATILKNDIPSSPI